MTRYKNKYRIESARLKGWNYSSNGYYFITVCTKNRECLFGDILNGKMALNKIGEIAKTEWLKTFEMRPDMNLKIDEFVVMPNHFHAILMIGENKYNTQSDGNRHRRDAMHCVSTTKKTTDMKKNKFGVQSKNLASTVRGFKIGVTKNVRQINPAFAWQPRFYDRVIRDESELNRIRKYIINNSQNWQKDESYISEMIK